MIAFDRSARTIDADGRLHVARTHISKAAVNPYYGREIPGFESLGLDPDRVYQLFRDPEELEKSAPTFARLPILSQHVPVTVDAPQPSLTVGAIGSDIVFNTPYLDADICIWDAEAIAGIESEKVQELSCAYRYLPVMVPGEYDGVTYDGRMTNIQGNHLAIVEVGRAGSDVIVADSDPFIYTKNEVCTMKMTRLGRALFLSISAISPTLAADSALPALVGNASRKDFDRKGVNSKLLALDAAINSEKLDAVIDAILDVEEDPKPIETPMAAADESPADKLRSLLAGKVDEETINAACALLPSPAAEDEENDDMVKKEDVEAAMDSLRIDLRDAAKAAREVSGLLGEVNMDSAEEIYGLALDHLKVERKGVAGKVALRALFKAATNGKQKDDSPVVVGDSAELIKQFPNVARFKRG